MKLTTALAASIALSLAFSPNMAFAAKKKTTPSTVDSAVEQAPENAVQDASDEATLDTAVEPPAPQQPRLERPKHFYASLELGGVWTMGVQNFWGDRKGAGFGGDFGYDVFNWASVGISYRSAISGATLILFGSGAISRFWGLDLGFTPVRAGSLRLMLGARAAQAHFEGSDQILFIPVNVYSLDTWAAGPTAALFLDVTSQFYVGLQFQYLRIMTADADYVGIIAGERHLTVPGFGYGNLELAAGLRF
jgi:hypothetical protein